MSSLGYFLGGLLIVLGLMYESGCIGHRHIPHNNTAVDIDRMIGKTQKAGDCPSCKWY